MISINTNLSSLIAQNNLKQSTNKLNTAIERMSTGFKINHANDNAANFSISTNMSTKISSYNVAEDNTEMAVNLATTAGDTLSLIEDRLRRLRMLQEQALNGTYGEQSLKAINEECRVLVDDINRMYLTTSYNGVNLFLEETIDDEGNRQILQDAYADESTKLKELGITTSSFVVFDKFNNAVETFDTEGTDTIGDIFATLESHGFTASIELGVISIKSNDGMYIDGDLVNRLDITTEEKSFIASTSQTSSAPIQYETVSISTTEVNYNVTTTTSATQTVEYTETITHTNTTTETIAVETTIGNSSTSSEAIKYTTTVTASVNVTTATALSTLGLTGNYYIDTVSFNGSTTIGELVTNLNNAGITTTFSDGILTIEGQILDESTIDSTKRVVNQTTFVSGQTYLISKSEDLVKLQTLVSAGVSTTNVVFEMTNNINMEGVSFKGIGNSSRYFCGVFNGNGHTISNLEINSSSNYVALFGQTRGANITSVKLEDASVSGAQYVGALVAYADEATTIENCSSINGYVYGSSFRVGGLVGYARTNSTISNCYSTGTVSGGNNNVGGLVGYLAYSTVEDSYSSAEVSANALSIGGLIGCAWGSSIDNSYSTGDVEGVDVGGLIGFSSSDTTINNCYAAGTITSSSSGNIGGFIGHVDLGLVINNSYFVGSVNGSGTCGGFIGYNEGSTITGSQNYYNQEAESSACGSGSFSGVEAQTTAEILTSSNLNSMGYTTANGWTVVAGQIPKLKNINNNYSSLYLTSSTTKNGLGLTNGTNKATSKQLGNSGTTT